MNDDKRPLSTLVGQGWEVISFSSTHNSSSAKETTAFLLRKGRQHKILRMRPKTFGSGRVVIEEDV